VLASVKRDRMRKPYARADTRDADIGSRKRTATAASATLWYYRVWPGVDPGVH